MTPSAYERSLYAKEECKKLARKSLLYRFTLYPIDLGLAWLFIKFSRKPS